MLPQDDQHQYQIPYDAAITSATNTPSEPSSVPTASTGSPTPASAQTTSSPPTTPSKHPLAPTPHNPHKRPRSSSPSPPSYAGLSSSGILLARSEEEGSSPKRTMSEEHLRSRESSPIVSLPTGEGNGSGSGSTKMAEVYPSPVNGTVEGEEKVEELKDGEDGGSGGSMEVDEPLQTGGGNLPSLEEQFRVIKEAVQTEIHPDILFYIIPSSWYLLLRHLANPTVYPQPKAYPRSATLLRPEQSSPADVAFLRNPRPATELLENPSDLPADEDGMDTAEGTAIEGIDLTATVEKYPNQRKLHKGLTEYTERGSTGKGAEDEEEGDMVYVAEPGWKKIVEWYGDEETVKNAIPRHVTSDVQGALHIEIDPPIFKLYRIILSSSTSTHISTDRPYRQLMPCNPNLSDVHTAVRLAFDIRDTSGAVPSRLWKFQQDPAMLAAAQAQAASDDSTTVMGKRNPTRQLPSHLLSALSATLVSDYPRPNTGTDKVLSEADCEDGDSFALEIGRVINGNVEWQVKVNEAGMAEEVPVADAPPAPPAPPAPLFNQPATYSGHSSSSNAGSSASATTSNGVMTRQKAQEAGVSGKKGPRGLKGLSNLGNTCFMNSGLQCLSNTRELSEYFQKGFYKAEINRQNPLGMKGQVADKFGNLIEQIWDAPGASPQRNSFFGGSGSGNVVTPREFKQMIGKFAPSFAGYGQQDTQELIAFLLDGLHEDLNRIIKKPYIEKPDWKDGGSEEDLAKFAKECWDGYKKRNDSVIVDLFQGQLKSTLTCPECHKKSITLDPFMYLTVPIPNRKVCSRDFFIQPADPAKNRIVVSATFKPNSTFADIKKKLGDLCGINPINLVATDEFSHGIYGFMHDDEEVTDKTSDTYVLHEVPRPVTQTRKGTHISTRSPRGDLIVVSVQSSFGHGDEAPSNARFTRPFFIAVTPEQARDVKAIEKAVVQGYGRFILPGTEDEWKAYCDDRFADDDNDSTRDVAVNVNELSISRDTPDAGDGHSAARSAQASPKAAPMPFRLFFAHDNDRNDQMLLPGANRMSYRRETVTERRKRKHGMLNRMKNAIGKVVQGNSTPAASEDEEEVEPNPLIIPGDLVEVHWTDINVPKKFFGLDTQEKYNVADNHVRCIDPDLSKQEEKNATRSKTGISLEDCLDDFEREEVLGSNDLWYCPHCKKHQAATKKMEIFQVPDILVICFKRFGSGTWSRAKIDTFVSFPEHALDLAPHCDERRLATALNEQGKDVDALGLTNAAKSMVYDLYAVDEHWGGLGGGHYTAVCKNADNGEWYKFDDSRVNHTTVENAQSSGAYLLFYRRRTEQPLGGERLAQLHAEGPIITGNEDYNQISDTESSPPDFISALKDRTFGSDSPSSGPATPPKQSSNISLPSTPPAAFSSDSDVASSEGSDLQSVQPPRELSNASGFGHVPWGSLGGGNAISRQTREFVHGSGRTSPVDDASHFTTGDDEDFYGPSKL